MVDPDGKGERTGSLNPADEGHCPPGQAATRFLTGLPTRSFEQKVGFGFRRRRKEREGEKKDKVTGGPF